MHDYRIISERIISLMSKIFPSYDFKILFISCRFERVFVVEYDSE